MNKKTKICVFNLKPKKVIQATKILKTKRGTKLTHNLNNKGRSIASDDDIINIKQQIHNMRGMNENEEVDISTRGMKSKMKQLNGKTIKPGPRSLLKAIDCLM